VVHEATKTALHYCGRGTIAAVVILASAGTGFLASRLWPLSTPLAPVLKITSSDATVLKYDSPSKQIDAHSALRAQADATVPATKSDVTDNPAGVPFVLLNPGTAEQPPRVEDPTQPSMTQRSDGSAGQQRTPPTRAAARPREEKAPSSQVARSPKKPQAGANLAQPAPSSTGSQRDAAMRDFMSHNPPFTR
jgi:hypothetical protein